MSTLLAIISTEHDNELIARHWPFFKRSGAAILGCGTGDRKCVWPEKIPELNTGTLGIRQTPAGKSIWGLCQQEIDIWRYFLEKTNHDSVCVVESDNLIVRKLPEHPGDGLYLVTLLANYTPVGLFKTPVYFQTPRWADRKCAEKLYKYGVEMLRNGEHEWWISDRFPAWITHKHKIPYIAQPAWSPFAFVWDAKDYDKAWVRDMRASVKIGNYCLHSVKTEWQLAEVKNVIKECGLPCPE